MDTTLLTIISLISGLILGWVTFTFNSKKEMKNDLKNDLESNTEQQIKLVELKKDLSYIKAIGDDTRLDIKELNRNVTDMNTRIVILEKSVKTAHERIDDIKKERKNI